MTSLSRRFLRLRWRFDFAGKNPKWGPWTRDPDDVMEKACFVNKSGLVRAAIEARCIETQETFIAAECDAHDFVNFKWLAFASANLGALDAVTTRIGGLTLVTREFETTVMTTGETRVNRRTDEDKKFHYATFGR